MRTFLHGPQRFWMDRILDGRKRFLIDYHDALGVLFRNRARREEHVHLFR